jgi:hypothetical protein
VRTSVYCSTIIISAKSWSEGGNSSSMVESSRQPIDEPRLRSPSDAAE